DAGQDGEIGRRDGVRSFGDGHISVEPCECREDGTHVAGAVVADGDFHNTPFVEGMPVPSARTAARSARPTAWNAASATSCPSVQWHAKLACCGPRPGPPAWDGRTLARAPRRAGRRPRGRGR